MSLYLLPELVEKSLDREVFPLLPDEQETFLLNGSLYPRFVDISRKRAPLFSGGILSSQEIELIAQGVSRAIFERHQGKSLLIVVVLEGARPFARLIKKHLNRLQQEGALQIQFSALQVSSYRKGSTAARHEIVMPLTDEVGGRMDDLSSFDLIIVLDDLIDSGETIHWLVGNYLQPFGVPETEAYFMLEKKVQRPAETGREIDLITPIIGRVVPDEWVVGFGLDLALPNGAAENKEAHLFRKALPGGIYAFNQGIEKALSQLGCENPVKLRKELGVYLTDQ